MARKRKSSKITTVIPVPSYVRLISVEGQPWLSCLSNAASIGYMRALVKKGVQAKVTIFPMRKVST